MLLAWSEKYTGLKGEMPRLGIARHETVQKLRVSFSGQWS